MSVPIASIGEGAFASSAPRSPFDGVGVGVGAPRSGVDPDSASLRASVRDENATVGAFAITGDSGIARVVRRRNTWSESMQNSNAPRLGFATRASDASRAG
jgi:hypothetical protein